MAKEHGKERIGMGLTSVTYHYSTPKPGGTQRTKPAAAPIEHDHSENILLDI